MQNKIRIAKYIANAGYCSRRDAEKLIEDRLVKINDQLCMHPSDTVTEKDKITIGKKIIKINQTIKLWKIYKPIKYICSTKDEHNRKKIFDLIKKVSEESSVFSLTWSNKIRHLRSMRRTSWFESFLAKLMIIQDVTKFSFLRFFNLIFRPFT